MAHQGAKVRYLHCLSSSWISERKDKLVHTDPNKLANYAAPVVSRRPKFSKEKRNSDGQRRWGWGQTGRWRDRVTERRAARCHGRPGAIRAEGHGQSVPLPPWRRRLRLHADFLQSFISMHQREIFKPDWVNNTWFLSRRNGLVIVGGVCRCCHQAITVSADHFSFFFVFRFKLDWLPRGSL